MLFNAPVLSVQKVEHSFFCMCVSVAIFCIEYESSSMKNQKNYALNSFFGDIIIVL